MQETGPQERPVPDFKNWNLADAQLEAMRAGAWILVEHAGESHRRIPAKAKGRIKENCVHNKPGERRPTGGELGVLLDVRLQWFWAIAPFLVSLFGGLLGGVASIYVAQQLGMLK